MRIQIVQDVIDVLRRKTSIIELFFKRKGFRDMSYVLKCLKKEGFKLKKTDNKNEFIFTNGKLNLLTDVTCPWTLKEVFADKTYLTPPY